MPGAATGGAALPSSRQPARGGAVTAPAGHGGSADHGRPLAAAPARELARPGASPLATGVSGGAAWPRSRSTWSAARAAGWSGAEYGIRSPAGDQ